jgi:glycine/D-amino acid oxidase-like deaminating enzyme
MSAFHIMKSMPGTRLTVLEKGKYIPNQYGTSSRSAACTRQQFGCELNVQMSMFSTRFYERFQEYTGDEMQMLWQVGYLFLYRKPEAWEAAQKRVRDQQNWGLEKVRALSADETLLEFPFVGNHGLLGATFCPTDGFLDPGIILVALKEKLKSMGAESVTDCEVAGFQYEGGDVTEVVLSEKTTILCDYVVNCTGAWSSRIGNMLGSKLEVGPEKRYLWSAEFANPQDDFPDPEFRRIPFIVCNGNGMTPYIKPEPGRNPHSFMMGCEHPAEPEWNFNDEDQDRVDPDFRANLDGGFHVRAWQEIASWIPFAEKLGFRDKVNSGYYETTKPHSPVIGFDPHHSNVIHCVGFSGHGIMHGPAAGQTVADLLEFGEYRTFPLGAKNLTHESLVNGNREVEGMKI